MRAFVSLLLLSVLTCSCSQHEQIYHFTEGAIFGTSYHITYEYRENKTLDQKFVSVLNRFNSSLSTYDPESVISKINYNDESVELDSYFTTCFVRAAEISADTDGAFDMTVAPLVNLWGFGFTRKDSVSPERIEKLLQVTGYKKIRLEEGRIIKDDPAVMLDASAIAKGYGVDVVSEFLDEQGVENYLIEIGGELRCKGVNAKGSNWKIGIDKPLENILERQIQAVLSLTGKSMATSGNYRQFYEENGVKYSHTIDPKTGYPVRHSLLSATVVSDDCMTADAYATAFMVMGLEKSKQMILQKPELDGFLIYSDDEGNTKTWVSDGIKEALEEIQ